jgi:orotate phosphoribosyltransferase-like protein
LENRRAEKVLSGELLPVCKWEEVGKGCRRVNMVQILCTFIYVSGKMRSVETIPGIAGGGIKENGGGGEFKYDIFDVS